MHNVQTEIRATSGKSPNKTRIKLLKNYFAQLTVVFIEAQTTAEAAVR